MFLFPPTIILRHKKENLKKCSLRNLETRKDLVFLTYPTSTLPNLDKVVLLTLDAPPLTQEDKDHSLFLIDGTWRYAAVMEKYVRSKIDCIPRSLPAHFVTAYPRKQSDCIDPGRGLASVEALFIAHHILGKSTEGLLDFYYWRDLFFEKNQNLLP